MTPEAFTDPRWSCRGLLYELLQYYHPLNSRMSCTPTFFHSLLVRNVLHSYMSLFTSVGLLHPPWGYDCMYALGFLLHMSTLPCTSQNINECVLVWDWGDPRVGGLIMDPPRYVTAYWFLKPENVLFYSKVSAVAIKLRLSKWRGYRRLSGWALKVIPSILARGAQVYQTPCRGGRGSVTTEARLEPCCHWPGVVTRSWKKPRLDSHSLNPRACATGLTFWLQPSEMDYWSPGLQNWEKINSCGFKPPGLW